MRRVFTLIVTVGVLLSLAACTGSGAPTPTPPYTAGDLITDYNGQRLYGRLFLPTSGPERLPAVILAHGLDGTSAGMIPYAERLAQEGFAAYAFDFRGGGAGNRSDGDRASMSILTQTEDLNAVVDTIRTRPDVDGDHLFLLGESQGGLVSAMVAGQHPDAFAGLVLLAPAFNLPDICRAELENPGGATPSASSFSRTYLEDGASIDVPAAIRPYERDVLIVHGDADPLVPIANSQQALLTYRSAELITVPGAGHEFTGPNRDAVVVRIITYLKQHLR